MSEAPKFKFQLMFSIDAVELHQIEQGALATAKTRRIRLPRDGELKESDPNVRLLRVMCDAGNAVLLG